MLHNMAEKPQDIEDLPGVGPSTAEKLREAGYLTIESVATTSPAELAEITEISEASRQPARRQTLTGSRPERTSLNRERIYGRSRSASPNWMS
jgi:predicted RecB family nuclease